MISSTTKNPLKTWLALVAGSLALVVAYAGLAGVLGYGFLTVAGCTL